MDTLSLVLLACILVCAGLVFRGVWVYRRHQKDSERLAATRLRMMEMTAQPSPSVEESGTPGEAEEPTEFSNPLPRMPITETADTAASTSPEPPSLNSPVVDVSGILEEAERQIRLGHLEDAARVLQKAVNRAPRQMELRFKLLEIHLATGNESGVTQQEMDIEAVGKEEDIAYCHQLITDQRGQSAVVNGD